MKKYFILFALLIFISPTYGQLYLSNGTLNPGDDEYWLTEEGSASLQ